MMLYKFLGYNRDWDECINLFICYYVVICNRIKYNYICIIFDFVFDAMLYWIRKVKQKDFYIQIDISYMFKKL